MILDDGIIKHLKRWLEHTYHYDDVDEAYERIVEWCGVTDVEDVIYHMELGWDSVNRASKE